MTGPEVTAAMKAEDVPAELVQQVADIILSRAIYEGREGDGVTQEDREDYAPYGHCLDAATCILAAVVPEIQAQARKEAEQERDAARAEAAEYLRMASSVSQSASRIVSSRAARLTATTEETAT